ncbi:MAG: hypothetical protein QOH25_3106 [Acidobacteriota bacterium]|jgi:predicted phosphohydrolase|nr:hypothetical protein [Acidobacteriota bacterium]
MRKLILRIALPLFLLSFAPLAYAQDDERPEFKMPCQEALKLGLNKFMDVYGEKTQDYSTAGQKQAFEYWVNCKRPANDALAAGRLSDEKRKQVDSAREEFNKFGTALWGLKYLEEGGGTMWGLISVGAYAERENFMEALIKTLAMHDRRLPRARRNVNASLAKIQRWLASNDRKPFTEGSEPEDVAQRKQSYQETIKETQDALAGLRDILSTLPDAAAERLAKEMASEAKNALADSP